MSLLPDDDDDDRGLSFARSSFTSDGLDIVFNIIFVGLFDRLALSLKLFVVLDFGGDLKRLLPPIFTPSKAAATIGDLRVGVFIRFVFDALYLSADAALVVVGV